MPERTNGRTAVLDDVPATGSACGDGRRFVREVLSRWGVPEETIETAMLVTSELVANAVNHAPPPGHLQVSADGRRVRIEVTDSSGREPRVVHPGDAVSGGRGLLLIERLADRWGWEPYPPGKIVWVELVLPGHP